MSLVKLFLLYSQPHQLKLKRSAKSPIMTSCLMPVTDIDCLLIPQRSGICMSPSCFSRYIQDAQDCSCTLEEYNDLEIQHLESVLKVQCFTRMTPLLSILQPRHTNTTTNICCQQGIGVKQIIILSLPAYCYPPQ